MDISFDLKHPKKYFLVTAHLADGKEASAICHSWTPKGAVHTVYPTRSFQRLIGDREVIDIKVEVLEEFESIQKDDFCVQTSQDGLSWIITNISDGIVYKMPKQPDGLDISLAELAYLDYKPVTDKELFNLYKRKLYIWIAKYGREMLSGTLS